MVSRRLVILAALAGTALSFFALGVIATRRVETAVRASSDASFKAVRREVRAEPESEARGLVGSAATASHPAEETRPGRPLLTNDARDRALATAREQIVAEVKQELQTEMGLLPLQLLRDRRSSFVELYSYDNLGETSYGTAGYLGHGYFITVKHAVVALGAENDEQVTRRIVAVKIVYQGKEILAKIIDTGDADVEVHSGDWAIIQTREVDLPPLLVDTRFAYQFADPIFRLGNDYSKGIILSTGYVGQRIANGLITCLTDGHPGVSGGGVLDQRGNLVGIPIGRMQGDFRFSFILPLRSEMFRKMPPPREPEIVTLAAEARQ